MALTDEWRTALMAYCRLDELDDGDLILMEELYAGAVSYMEDAGIGEPAEETARRGKYDLCVNALVLDAWDNRGTQTAGHSMADNPAFRRILNQLKLTEPVSNSDTGTGV